MIRLITETSYNWVDTLPMMGKKVPVFGFQVEKGKKKNACVGKYDHTVEM